MATPTPFQIAAPDSELSWITDRVKTARLVPPKELPEGKEWSYGPPAPVAARLKEYWSTSYDWRKVEAKLNAELKQFTLPVSVDDEDLTIHFVHHRSSAPDAIPLILPHGWPGNFLEARHIIGDLTDPLEEGAQAYHVVAPSLPGFGFSSYPKKPFSLGQIGTTFHKLMLALGYNKYIAQGGDWGSMIVRYMGNEFGPEHCIGVHVNFIMGGPPSLLRTPVTMARLVFAFTTGWGWGGEYANAMIKRQEWWRKEEAGYQQISSTKPLTVGAALSDSPMGMMLWIYDKMRLLVDDDFVWDDETIITWAMIYVLNGTAGHAEIYKWMNGPGLKVMMEQIVNRMMPRSVPFGVSVFPKDPSYAPRWWVAATVAENITFWKEHDKGGHFAATEKPKELAEDIREWSRASGFREKMKMKED